MSGPLKPASLIDLSLPLSDGEAGVSVRLQGNLPVYLGRRCSAWDLEIPSHTGTYFETSSHVFRGGRDTEPAAIETMCLPGACLRVRTGGEKCLTADDLQAATADAPLPAGCGLLIDTGGDRGKYFSRDAAEWMAERRVALMGSDTERYDSGFEDPTGFFEALFAAEIPIIANLANLDRLPERLFELWTLPLKVVGEGVCTVPARVVARLG
jgi:kynurenine formamidase